MDNLTSHSILIVDDEKDIIKILKLHLEETGYLISSASDGESGLAMLRSGSYDLALLDVRMPGLSGLEVLQRLQDDHLDTAVIIMTAHGNENLAVDCMKSGATDYVAKPFDVDDLLLRIERAILNRQMVKDKLLLEKEKEDFILMLSHDMKNPITAVIGSIDIMREGRLGAVTADQADYLQSAIESCEEVVTMIDNLLDMQRYKTGKMRSIISNTDPYALIESTIKHFSPAAERENVVLTLDAHRNLPEIAVDSSVMSRVIANLVGNAVKFVPEGGTIDVSCRCLNRNDPLFDRIPENTVIPDGFADHGCYVKISVSDSGDGISPEDLTSIFNRYVQADNSSTRSKGGAGLGLAFCKNAVESFKGCIWAESDKGEGSVFTILLPGNPKNCSCNDLTTENIA